MCYVTYVFILQSRDFSRVRVERCTFDTGSFNYVFASVFFARNCYLESIFSSRKGRIFQLTGEFKAYERNTQTVDISAEQSYIPKYNAILSIRSSASQLIFAHFDSTFLAMKSENLLENGNKNRKLTIWQVLVVLNTYTKSWGKIIFFTFPS